MPSARETLDWVSDLINSEAAEKKTGEFVISVEDNQAALVVPEESAVYLITVQEAAFVVASNRESRPE